MPRFKPTSILTADASSGVPFFINVRFLAESLGVTRDCIYFRAKNNKFPPYDSDNTIAKGWFASTLDKHNPDLMKLVRAYHASRVKS